MQFQQALPLFEQVGALVSQSVGQTGQHARYIGVTPRSIRPVRGIGVLKQLNYGRAFACDRTPLLFIFQQLETLITDARFQSLSFPAESNTNGFWCSS